MQFSLRPMMVTRSAINIVIGCASTYQVYRGLLPTRCQSTNHGRCRNQTLELSVNAFWPIKLIAEVGVGAWFFSFRIIIAEAEVGESLNQCRAIKFFNNFNVFRGKLHRPSKICDRSQLDLFRSRLCEHTQDCFTATRVDDGLKCNLNMLRSLSQEEHEQIVGKPSVSEG